MAYTNPDNPNKLTEFAPLSSDMKPLGGLWSRIFKRSTPEGSKTEVESGEASALSQDDVSSIKGSTASLDSIESDRSKEDNLDLTGSCSSLGSGTGTAMPSHHRTLSSVLKRLSNILDRRSQTPQAYKDSDFKQFWMPDSNCRECYECGDRFNTFRRRHHCRICGQIFCSRCCNQEVAGKIMGYTGSLRVCTYCCKVVLSYAQNPDASQADLGSLSEDLRSTLTSPDSDPTIMTSLGHSDDDSWMGSLPRKRPQDRKGRFLFDDDISSVSDGDLNSQSLTPFDVSMETETSTMESLQRERQVLLHDSVQLRELWQLMQDGEGGVEVQTHRHRLRTYTHCMVGSHIVQWLIQNDHAVSRDQAIVLGQALVEANWLQCVTSSIQLFRDDFSLYQAGEMAAQGGSLPYAEEDASSLADDSEAPLWFREINDDDSAWVSHSELEKIPSNISAPRHLGAQSPSVFIRDPVASSANVIMLDTQPACSYTARPINGEDLESGRSEADLSGIKGIGPMSHSHSPRHLPRQDSIPILLSEDLIKGAFAPAEEDTGIGDIATKRDISESEAHEKLKLAQHEHMAQFTNQLLRQYGLSKKWAEIVISLANKISSIVQPNVRDKGDSMDIRKYVQIKKIASTCPHKSTIIWGVVCSKNIAHKKMRSVISAPKILLLRAPIEYQRVEQKFSSLEPQILQEHEHLKKSVARIAELQPDILLVEKTVSRLAQDFLLHAGITLVTNVKTSVLERVSRMTQADIVNSIDSLVSKTSLGTCQSVRTQSFTLTDGTSKTLLYFDGCQQGLLGCTVLLHASSQAELKRVKAATDFLIYMSYNAKLELSFLMEEYAAPPVLPQDVSFFLSSDSSLEDIDTGLQMVPVAPDNTSKTPSDSCSVKCDDGEDSGQNGAPMTGMSIPQDTTSISQDATDGAMSSKTSSREAASIAVLDQSDPLQNYLLSQDETIFTHQGDLKEEVTPSSLKFKKVLNDVILSVSPFVKFDIPYLETLRGSNCELRGYFPRYLYSSKLFKNVDSPSVKDDVTFNDTPTKERYKLSPRTSKNVKVVQPHVFVKKKLTSPVTGKTVQALLADFRARGGTIKLNMDAKKEEENEIQMAKAYDSNSHMKDCLDPKNHQSIAVLFSSFSYVSVNTPNPCVYPWVVNMDFYGKNDMTLGLFLERYCFRDSYKCPSKPCETAMVDHIRRFVHDTGCLQVMLKKVEDIMPGGQNNILMWSWCRLCKQVTPVETMSLDTWNMSFAKYLELRFHGSAYRRRCSMAPCDHSLHYDHYQYFGCKQVIASFRYSSILLREVSLPPVVLRYTPPQVSPGMLHIEAEQMLIKGTDSFNSALEFLHRLKQTIETLPLEKQIQQELSSFKSEAAIFLHAAELLASEADPDNLTSTNYRKEVIKVQETIIHAKHELAETVSAWNTKLQEMEQAQRRQEKSWSLQHSSSTSRITVSSTPSSQTEIRNEGMSVSTSGGHWVTDPSDTEPTFIMSDTGDEASEGTPVARATASASISSSDVAVTTWGLGEAASSSTPESSNSRSVSPNPINIIGQSKSGSSDELDRTLSGNQPKGHQRSWSYGETKKLVKQATEPGQYEPEKKTGVKNLLSSLLSSAGPNPVHNPFPVEEHHGLEASRSVPVVVYDTEPSSIIAYALSSSEYEEQLRRLEDDATGEEQPSYVTPSNNSTPESKRKTNTRVLSFMRGNMMSKEKQPSKAPAGQTGTFEVDTVKYTPNTDMEESVTSIGSTESDAPSSDSQLIKAAKIPKDSVLNSHIELQFSDNSHKFYCRVYYADEFRKLRQLIFPHGEDQYVRSLSRCFTWLASGGKSGSSFCKTQEDRFILKQMSRYEVQSFTEFAPHYFDYITKAHQLKRPTALAKILGVYRIGSHSNQTNAARKQDLLVMENLFYNKNITQIFDLKGSMRNRLVSTSGKRMEDLVLLDENLLKLSIDSPLYIGQHSKAVLYAAIMTDTDFLSNHLVMDYSLLVGLDEENKQLVVGIIDYIRTFTWDKKIEMVFKQLGSQGKMPTVVSPNLYKTRFREAMTRYFLHVPDTWTGLGLAETLP